MQPFLNPPDNGAPVVIYEDGGGLVRKYEEAAIQYNLEKRRVEIRGSCRSACTLALSVKSVCVGKGAKVLWHHAFNTDDHTPRYDVTREMLSLIPFKVAQRVQPFISIQYNTDATLDYKQLTDLGVADCDNPAPTVQASVTAAPQLPPNGGATREQTLAAIGYKTGAAQYAENTATSTAQIDEDPIVKKKLEFDEAYNHALEISKQQHGSPATLRNCDKNNCEEIVAYYDKHSRYVELHRSLNSENRVLCRLTQEGLFEDSYDCQNWLTGKRSAYHWQRDPLY